MESGGEKKERLLTFSESQDWPSNVKLILPPSNCATKSFASLRNPNALMEVPTPSESREPSEIFLMTFGP